MPVWSFPPAPEYREVLQWRTSVANSFNGEQRNALLKAPRQSFFFTHPFTHAQLEKAEAVVSGAGAGSYDVPVWVERKELTISAGGNTIVMDTSIYDYRVDGKLILWQDANNYEVHTIQSIGGSPNTITLFTTINNNYTNGYVMPVRTCFSPNGLDIPRSVGPVINCSMHFDCFDNVDLSDASLFGTYRSQPFVNNPAVLGNLTLRQATHQPQHVLDNRLSTPYFDTSRGFLEKIIGTRFHATTQTELWNLRTFLHSLYGRQKGFWLPTYVDGLALASDISSADTSVVISNSAFDGNIESGDIFIRQNDGTETTLQFTSVTIPSPANNTEELNLSGTAGVDISAANVERLSLLLFVRQLGDRLEIVHNNATGSFVATDTKQVPVV